MNRWHTHTQHMLMRSTEIQKLIQAVCLSMTFSATEICFCTKTPGNLVRGSRWLCNQNPYASFRLWLTRHPNVNKRVISPDLLIFRQFHRHILKNRTMLFPTTFISTSEKIGVGLEKQEAIFYFSFTRRWVVRYSCFDFFSSAIWR